jgi:hypothetical protein
MTLDVMKNEMVALARRHIIEARAIVEHQRLRVQRLASAGRSIEDAKRTLELFERTLAIFEKHLHDLTKGADHGRRA